MKRMSVIILSLLVAHSSITLAQTTASSNVAAIALICKEATKFTAIKNTPLKGLLEGLWCASAWYDSAEVFVPKTRTALKSRSPRALLQVLHAASAGAYMGLSIAKSYNKYKSAGREDEINDNLTPETDSEIDISDNKKAAQDEFETSDLANNVCATGSVLLASTLSKQIPASLKKMMSGVANTLQVYPDVEYVVKHTKNALRNGRFSLDAIHALTATAFMATTLLTRGIRIAA